MEFILETAYDHKTLKTLSMGLRKVLRPEKNRIAYLIGALLLGLGGFLAFSGSVHLVSATLAAVAIIGFLAAVNYADDITAWIALRKKIPGLDKTVTTFREDRYHSANGLGEADFSYEDVFALAETQDFFLLLFNPRFGQIFSKASLSGGTMEEFRTFLQEKTQLTMQEI